MEQSVAASSKRGRDLQQTSSLMKVSGWVPKALLNFQTVQIQLVRELRWLIERKEEHDSMLHKMIHCD